MVSADRDIATLAYIVIVGITAACGLIVEIVAGRMLAPYVGMSLYTWTSIIAVVLAGFSIGHWIGGRLADNSDRDAYKTVAWSLFLCAVSTSAVLVLIRVLSGPIIELSLSSVPTILLLTTVLFFLPSLFVGVPTPILVKIAITESPDRMGRILGAMFASGAFGSILGTLAAGFVFISWLGSMGTIILVSLVYFLLALAFFAIEWRKSGTVPQTLIICLFLFVLSYLTIGYKVRAFASNCGVESSYYCLRVIDVSRHLGQPARAMIIDHLSHGTNFKVQPGQFFSSYVELTDRLIQLQFPPAKKISAFFIGGGAYTLPRAWIEKGRNVDITVAEIDPAVTKLAIDKLWLRKTSHLKVDHEDGRSALRATSSKKYEVIIADAFHDIAVPQHLVTLEFFKLVKNRLTEDGSYIMTAVDFFGQPRFRIIVG